MKELKSLSMDQRKLKPPSKATAIVAEPPHTLPLDSKLMDSDKCLESEFTKLLDYEVVDKGAEFPSYTFELAFWVDLFRAFTFSPPARGN